MGDCHFKTRASGVHRVADVPGEVTWLLRRIDEGDRGAVESLLPLVYRELREIAAARMAQEAPDHTLQPTALVHEAWIRLVETPQRPWTDRKHFYRAAAAVMRHILVDHARARDRLKRGGGQEPIPLGPDSIAIEDRAHDLVALDEAMQRLEAFAPRQIDLIELRFFAGLTMEESAQALGISERTAYTEWRLARAWLLREMAPA